MAHKEFGNIFLSWRLKKGDARNMVGVLRETSTGVVFSYTEKGKELAQKHSFNPYAGFPDIDMVYQQNVLDIFGQRLMRPERPDIQRYYDLWNIPADKTADKLYLLAKTQGIQAGDMFEFLADYNPVKNLSFVSEICGLSHSHLRSDIIQKGDILQWKRENHTQDKYAVALYKNGEKLGYVKQIHNRIFSKTKHTIQIKVVSIETNGHLKKAYIQISL